MASPKLPPGDGSPKPLIGFVVGTFDLLHAGHLHLLRLAKEACFTLIVALDSDRRARLLKGEGRPVESEAVRSHNLIASGLVDLVVGIDRDPGVRDAIRYYEPDILFAGADPADGPVLGQDLVPIVTLIPLLPGHSTTNQIKARLQ